jgi:cold shock CspA family protein
MIGIIKKFDPQGFGIIKASDGSKLAFILSDFARHQSPQEGQKVIFSIRSVKAVFSPAMSIRSGKLSRQFSQQLLAATIGLCLPTLRL